MLRLPVVVACWPQAGAQWSGVGDGKGDGEGVGSGMVAGVFCPWDLGSPGMGPASSLRQAQMRKHPDAEN